MRGQRGSRGPVSRRGLLAAGAGVAGGLVLAGPSGLARAAGGNDNSSGDTPQQVFTAALIAEDLATTFYYNLLSGGAIHDPALAGSGTVQAPGANGNAGNVEYVQAALTEEIAHATLLRSLIGGSTASGDPYQTFYFPTGSFDTLSSVLALLDALENAFIGAYLTAAQEFAQMAADTAAGRASYTDSTGNTYTSFQLEYFAQVAGAIMGVESEHRVLGRVIGNSNPANDRNYEQTDGLGAVYNDAGGTVVSAVDALKPFLASGPGLSGYTLAAALAGAASVTLTTPPSDSPPASGGTPGPNPTPGGTATPELGSGELLATGLLSLAGLGLYRYLRPGRRGQTLDETSEQ